MQKVLTLENAVKGSRHFQYLAKPVYLHESKQNKQKKTLSTELTCFGSVSAFWAAGEATAGEGAAVSPRDAPSDGTGESVGVDVAAIGGRVVNAKPSACETE